MGLHIGNSYRPATFHCMADKADGKRKDTARGSRVRGIRLALKLNQVELAEKLEVDQSTVSDIENGAGFSADLLMRMCAALGVSPSLLMRGSDELTWPFPNVPVQRFMALNERQRGVIEGRLLAALDELDAPSTEDLKAFAGARLRTTKTPGKKRAA